jgi:hypothetical protein
MKVVDDVAVPRLTNGREDKLSQCAIYCCTFIVRFHVLSYHASQQPWSMAWFHP